MTVEETGVERGLQVRRRGDLVSLSIARDRDLQVGGARLSGGNVDKEAHPLS